MRKIFLLVGMLIVCSFGSQVSAAMLYLKNGEELECQSFKRSGNVVQVIVNRDTVLEFKDEEVDFTKSKIPVKKAKKHAAAPTARKAAKAIPGIKPSAAGSDDRIDGVFYGAVMPQGTIACSPQLQRELLARFRNFSRAAERGDWRESSKQMLTKQAKKTEQLLAGLSEAEMEKRRKVLRSLAVNNYQPQGCRQKDDFAVLAGRGDTTSTGKPQNSHVTVLFRQEGDGWKVQSTMFNHSYQ